MTKQPETKSEAWLDWLRFLAAFEVMVSHVRGWVFVDYAHLPIDQQTAPTAAFFLATRLGAEAVVVFFVLSGFLVGGRAMQLAVARRFVAQRYVIDRVTRIMVVLLPALALTACAEYFVTAGVPWDVIVGNTVSLQGVVVDSPSTNAPLWSLAFEVWFYAWGGSVSLLVSRRRLNWFAGALFCISTLVLLKLGLAPLAWWCCGAAAFLWARRRGMWLIVTGGLLALGGIALYQLVRPTTVVAAAGTSVSDSFVLVVALSIVACGVALLLASVRGSRFVDGAPWRRLAHALANISFSLYLTHYPVLAMIHHVWPERHYLSTGSLFQFVVEVTVSLGVAALFYVAFERHTGIIRHVGYRFISRGDKSAATLGASEHAV